MSSNSHYYYGNFLSRYYKPSKQRTPEQNRISGQQVDLHLLRGNHCPEIQVLQECLHFIGFMIFVDLIPSKTVVDVMLALTLNLIRSEVEKHLLAELGPNATCSVLSRDTAGVLDRRTLSKALDQVPWTTELKGARIPSVCPSDPSGKRKLGF